ncbi:MAG TPA: LamG domain-containing protein, partial [Clostridia bacterium]|nr:LamG domain-containing protein [Clostridia bacterium]
GFTYGVWIYKEKSSTNQPIFAKYGESHDKAAAAYQLEDWNDSTGQRLSVFDFADEQNAKLFDTDDINGNSDGRWFYYTATYDGQNVKKYINGVLIGTEPFDGDISNSTGPLWIGATTESIFFKGIMDEFRIYNYALKPTEVKNLYNMRDGIETLVSKKSVSAVTLKAKQTLQLETNLVTYTYQPTNNLKQSPAGKDLTSRTSITNNAVYKSGNSKIISISKSGNITALSKGKTTLTITYGRFTKSITVTVK